MKTVFLPSKATGTVDAPPSKSLSHRYLICGALSEKSNIYNVSDSLDVKATLNCLSTFGADIKKNINTVCAGGIDFTKIGRNITADCGESGSTLRFLIPLCLTGTTPVTFTGTKALFSRPLEEFERLCKSRNLPYNKAESSVTVCGPLTNGSFFIDGSISSQFVSGLLFALPLLNGKSTLKITGSLSSAPYIALTVKALTDFGININKKSDTLFEINGNQKYKSRNIFVEGDYSNAVFFDAFNLLGGSVTVNNLNKDSVQGDKIYKKYFEQLINGCPEIDLTDFPDLAPVLFAVSALLNGARFINTERLRFKECNRTECMKKELMKFGVKMQIEENAITVEKSEIHKPVSTLFSHNDHRVAMALSLLCTVTGGEIENTESVNKSYPAFFDDLKRINISFQTE